MNFLAEVESVLWIATSFAWFAAGASLAYWQPASGVRDEHYRIAFYVYFIGAFLATATQLAIAYTKRHSCRDKEEKAEK